MYMYKTEVLTVSSKWFTDQPSDQDLFELDRLLNERSVEGWELASYDYMTSSSQVRGVFVVTFRKEI